MKKILSIILVLITVIGLSMFVGGCIFDNTPTSDDIQQQQQETVLKEGTAQVGMPAIKNFRERKILKDIFELRDQDSLVTYSYIFSQYTGKFTYIGVTVGYPIPYATQFTNPQKIAYESSYGIATLPQADPNGLFSPQSADGTWVLMLDTTTHTAKPQYIEEKVEAFTSKLPASMCN